MEDILFTVKEASALLKTDEPTIRRLINKGLMNNDTKFIEKNIGQIVSYVKKRKNFLKL